MVHHSPSPHPLSHQGRGAKKKLGHAKYMRSHATDAEQKLWQILRAKRLKGWKFKRQVPIGVYIVDFICFEAKLVIEADGSQHHRNEKDQIRDQWLREQGYKVLRYWNNDILTNIEGVELNILEVLSQ